MATDDETREERATRLYELGRDAYRREQHAEAVELFRASAQLSPHFKTLELLGESLLKLGQIEDAAIYLAAAAGLAPKQSRPRFLLAQILAAWGAVDDARTQLSEALRVTPHYKSAAELLETLPCSDENRGTERLPNTNEP